MRRKAAMGCSNHSKTDQHNTMAATMPRVPGRCYAAAASNDAPLRTSTILPITPSNSCACLAWEEKSVAQMIGLIFLLPKEIK